ncbi:MAG TPA: T9SS type A sorting domain-containing protein [Bacteroidales bacterium]|nr:T9SS type A sorting domain-containing protein [Bacteroidales bacterium]
MKLKTLIFAGLFLLGIAGISNAQTPQVNNGDFEAWDNPTTSSIEPANWNSFMTANSTFWTSFGKKKRVDRSPVVRPGTTGIWSALIYSTDETVAIANGNITTGKINMGDTDPTNTANYNFTSRSEGGFYHSFTGHPDSLVVWVRFKPFSGGTEQARIHAVIHDNYDVRDPADANSTSHIVGSATLNFTKTNGIWVRKSIPFIYSGPSSTPLYLLISLTTNMTPGGGSGGDSLYVDDMALIYNPVLTTGAISPNTFIVDAGNSAAIDVPFTLTGTMNAGNNVTAQLSDASGSFASPVILGTLATTTSGTISGTIPAGTLTGGGYRVRVVSSDYALTAADNGSDLVITNTTGISDISAGSYSIYFSENELISDLNLTQSIHPKIQVFNLSGQLVAGFDLQNNAVNHYHMNIPAGIYMYRLINGDQMISGKIVKF